MTGEYSKELDDAVNELKANEERGHEYMLLMTYAEEQKTAGKYIKVVEVIRSWLEDKDDTPVKKLAKILGITIRQFEEAVSLIKEHPDWDDDDVADKVDWRK